jgi:PAS domain S-box-containing protein
MSGAKIRTGPVDAANQTGRYTPDRAGPAPAPTTKLPASGCASPQALREANEELERRVRERTADLTSTVEQLQVEAARRSLAEKALQDRSMLLEAFFRHATNPLVFLDRSFNFLRVNEAYARSCGKKVEDFPGHNHFEFYPHKENQAIFRQVVRTKKPFQVYAKPFEFPDHPEWGVSYWDWELSPLLDAKGEVEYLVFSLEDVTEKRLAENKLKESALYARSLLEASLDPMVTISPQGKITDVNKATEEVTGLPREKVIGRDFCDFFTEPAKARDGYRRVLSGGVIRDFPLTVRHVSGKTVDVLYHATVYRNKAGEVQGVFASARDITELKGAHASLQAYAAQLKRLAMELTQTEHRERRRLAQLLHDHLQQLLVGAKFGLGNMIRSPQKAIRLAALKVDELISQSIEASRTLTGELSPPILHEGGLVLALEWLAGWMKDKQGLSVDLSVDERVVPAGEDVSALLYQAVRELLFNVVKHAGVKTARVSLKRLDGHIQIEVSDEGTGFDLAGVRPGRSKGTGLGLFSVRERLELMGARMAMDSAPGRGSRFTMVAPVVWPEETGRSIGGGPARAGGQGDASPANPPAGAERRIRVLLADDHTVTRQGLARLLDEEGYFQVVGEASDGHSAVDLARKLVPDVVVMDIGMPGLGGVEATRIIHRELPEVRVVALSMFEESQRSTTMLQAGLHNQERPHPDAHRRHPRVLQALAGEKKERKKQRRPRIAGFRDCRDRNGKVRGRSNSTSGAPLSPFPICVIP